MLSIKNQTFSHYLWKYLVQQGCKTVFIVTGGYSMYLHDALLDFSELTTITCHHEQGAIYAAIGYSKINKDIPIVCVTSGCGLTNTITGIIDCWQDSVPVLVLCGQSNSKETINYNTDYKGRNFSGQDVDVAKLCESITKYSKQLNNIDTVCQDLEESFVKMTEKRMGPSVLCIPLDIQRSKEYKELDLELSLQRLEAHNNNIVMLETDKTVIESMLNKSERPIIIAGNGIKLASCVEKFQKFVHKYSIPVVTTFLGIDSICDDDCFYSGRIGIMGKRNGNFAVQNSDLILCLGSRLPVSVVGYQFHLFAREAKIIIIDIDKEEHLNKPYSSRNTIFEYPLQTFFATDFHLDHVNAKKQLWIEKCQDWKQRWNYEVPDKNTTTVMNPYHVFLELNNELEDGQPYNIVSNGGNNFYLAWQTLIIRPGYKFITSASQGDLGWELPASIGAYLANKHRTICVSGDGSFQFTIQELETIRYHNLPILILIINNSTYGAIEVSQRKFFKRHIGIDDTTGISIPSFKNICTTYQFEYKQITKYEDIKGIFSDPNLFQKPMLCEFLVSNQERYPQLSTFIDSDNNIVSLPFEDMFPFLSLDTIQKEMFVPLAIGTQKRLNIFDS